MNNAIDARNACQFCGTKTWSKDYAAFMRDHDRADGTRCIRAAKVYKIEIHVPAWAKVAS